MGTACIHPVGREGSGELLERALRRSEQGPDVDGRRQVQLAAAITFMR
jgi:hypothetical protein